MRSLINNAAALWRNSIGFLRKVEKKDCPPTKRPTLLVDNHFSTRLRLFLRDLGKIMEGSSSSLHPTLSPPSCVNGMTELQKDMFVKRVKLPGVKLPKNQINATRKSWKPFLLKLQGLSPIGELSNKDSLKETHSLVLFDPGKLETGALPENAKETLDNIGFNPAEKYELELGYDNWSVSEILKAVLPKASEGVSSFTQIGHIAHLNLKPENMQFKNVIGQVILDKIASVKTVVNKLNTIDNTYRNFEMELLAGEDNFVTQTKENGFIFELDFSKVYWNSRLSTEHQRIVDAVQRDSIVYDVFAGVGPFAIPVAKRKGCKVYANDLNPHSFQSLERNVTLNKVKSEQITTSNLDGREFIKTVVKSDIVKRLNAALSKNDGETDIEQNGNGCALEKDTISSAKENVKDTDRKSYAIMNLPALAVDFLDSFNSLLSDLPQHLFNLQTIDKILPIVYCYAFCSKSGNVEDEVRQRAQGVLQHPLPADASVRIVRNVSPNKEMVCLYFKIWPELVLGERAQGSGDASIDEPITKKQKLTS